MRMALKARSDSSSKIVAAVFFLVTAVSLTTTELFAHVGIAAIPFGFLCAGVLVFFRARVAYVLGLVAAVFGFRWFIVFERYSERSGGGSPWNSFNGEFGWGSECAVLIILSVALLVVSGVCATLRLLPARWTMRSLPLSQRTWPAVTAGFLALGIWLFHAGTPYQFPLIVDAPAPTFRILHVEKRGLHFHETAISVHRNGTFFVERTERNLFQYKFETHGFQGYIPYEQVETFRTLAELWKLRTAPAQLLHSWNAEGWYAVSDAKILAFTTENKAALPQLVVDMFSELNKLPAEAKWTEHLRDICLGFCYGPVAALGFRFANSFPLLR